MANTYQIAQGDTLSGIAQQQGTSVQNLMKLNPSITNPNLIIAGKTLNLDNAPTNPTSAPTPTITPSANPNIIQPPTSNVQSQIAGLQATLQQKQDALANAQKQGANPNAQLDENGNILPGTTVNNPPQPQSNLDKILANNQNTAAQEAQLRTTTQSQIQEKINAENELIAPMNAVSAQIENVNKQIADLETRKNQALDDNTNKPGQDLAFMNGENARITRAYAIQESGLAGQASALGTQLASMQGNFNMAKSLADQAITALTTGEKQKIDDLQWASTNYANVLSAMNESDQQTYQNAVAAANLAYNQKNTQLTEISKMVTDPTTSGAFQGTDWTKMTLADASQAVERYTNSSAYLHNLNNIAFAKSTKVPTVLGQPNASNQKISDIGTVQNNLKYLADSNGYVSPQSWNSELQKWVAAGYKESEFASNFKNFTNPKTNYGRTVTAPPAPKNQTILGTIGNGLHYLRSLLPF